MTGSLISPSSVATSMTSSLTPVRPVVRACAARAAASPAVPSRLPALAPGRTDGRAVEKRSYIKTVTATDQPPPVSPTRRSSSMWASVKNTSLKPCWPFIWCSGRTSMPGWPTSMMKKLRPRCLGTSRSVRASSIPRSAHWAPEVHTFWPSAVQPPSPGTALVCALARSEPGSGLREELAPQFLAAHQDGQEPGLLLLAAVNEQHRAAQQLAEPGGRGQRPHLREG